MAEELPKINDRKTYIEQVRYAFDQLSQCGGLLNQVKRKEKAQFDEMIQENLEKGDNVFLRFPGTSKQFLTFVQKGSDGESIKAWDFMFHYVNSLHGLLLDMETRYSGDYTDDMKFENLHSILQDIRGIRGLINITRLDV